ncbi:MAG: glucuronate isomerase [Bacteroides sp.]|nr:glucuronate isomerase [Bacteroides sp.]MCM1095562.1 glucuronate isomerase [Terasakiella sp.]
MAQSFTAGSFMLETQAGRMLYEEHAARLPIIDYHCHLSPEMIDHDHSFKSITELWLGGDHYKWRAMRANGVDERYISGDASDREKFEQWAYTVPYTLRNPLYHWTHLELNTAFGIADTLSPATARSIYDRCNELLRSPDMTARGLMRRYRVETVCTTDDPVDSLVHHRNIKESGFEIKVLPTWRPDKAMAVEDTAAYNAYLERLGEAADVDITDYGSLIAALQKRHDHFAHNGCRLADHGLGKFPFRPCQPEQAHRLFAKVRDGNTLHTDEAEELKTSILLDLARMNHAKGWAQQFHFGPLRNVNTRRYKELGPDTGFDTIGDYCGAEAIAGFLDTLDSTSALAKTILYNLNPADNVWVAAMIANFQDGSTPGKIQMGSGWWFNDQIDGMERQINALSSQGLLSRFVGMLTDSRSFVSYPRHEYFRRVLCNVLGKDIEKGLIPRSELATVEKMVEDICYHNAREYFGF